MNLKVIGAIFRRNFFAYFRNPTGYVFIIVFVLLCSWATIWPDEFYNANLANLNLLNAAMPYILLVFVPAITMSIWAEERRQGTDELLLTIPAGDFDVVLGKYLAALAIYSSALAYAMLCSLSLLALLGSPDLGLLAANYVGYWMIGAAMISIGMVASFLTANLTVGFVLGAAFNGALVFLAKADLAASLLFFFKQDLDLPEKFARDVKEWSPEEIMRHFGRGVVSLQSVAYFGSIVAVMLYLSMVLIGRRHWQGGRDGRGMGWHYLARAVCLVGIAASLVAATGYFGSRWTRADLSSEGLSSLAPSTLDLLDNLEPEHAVYVDAFISPSVDLPEAYVETRLNLKSILDEIKARSGGKVVVREYETDPYGDPAKLAEEQHEIVAVTRQSRSRGTVREVQVFLGVAVSSGLNKVVLPFIDLGTPIEYELIRAIGSVAKQDRKTIGVLQTQAQLFGGFDPQTMQVSQEIMLIRELKRQYNVVKIPPAELATTECDALMVVQPSTLSPPDLETLISAVKAGKPTAIFEDPAPIDLQLGSTMQRAPPSASVTKLWHLLGVEFSNQVVWHPYISRPEIRNEVPEEILFVSAEGAGRRSFNQDSTITSGLQQLLFFFSGSLASASDDTDIFGESQSKLKFERLVETSLGGGTSSAESVRNFISMRRGAPPPERISHPDKRYVLAARIHGEPPAENLPMANGQDAETEDAPQATVDETSDSKEEQGNDAPVEPDVPSKGKAKEKEADAPASKGGSKTGAAGPAKSKAGSTEKGEGDKAADAAPAKPANLNVVLVADADLISDRFFNFRAQGGSEEAFNFDNVTFVFNVLDVLAGDDRFVEIRKRRPRHRTLGRLEEQTKPLQEEAVELEKDAKEEFDKALRDVEADIERLGKDVLAQEIDELAKQVEMRQLDKIGQRRIDVTRVQLQKKLNRETADIKRGVEERIRTTRLRYKMGSILVPPVLPVLLGLFVYFHRRAQEREGVARTRLRS